MVVEGDDEFGATERFIEPLAVARVEDPFGFGADVVDEAALSVSGHLDPAGFPRQIVDGVPPQTGDAGQACSKSRLPRPGDPVDQYPTSAVHNVRRHHHRVGDGRLRRTWSVRMTDVLEVSELPFPTTPSH